MKWPWLPLRLGDYIGIALLVAILVVIAIGVTVFPREFGQTTTSAFGPDWDCTSVPEGGDPICVKKIVRK